MLIAMYHGHIWFTRPTLPCCASPTATADISIYLTTSGAAVDMHFVMPDGAKGKNTDPEHLAKYYSKFSQVINENYDGVIVTGAPVIYHRKGSLLRTALHGLLRSALHWPLAHCLTLSVSC